MNAPPGDIKKGRKYQQVLDGARQVFMADGYEGAGVDDIAAAANVSKATLYSYFPDKATLFMEVASIECRRQADAAVANIDTTQPAKTVLTLAAGHLVAFSMSNFGVSIYRISVAEAVRFPELARQFYETGPLLGQDILQAYLAEATARGELKIAEKDLSLAAAQFMELCRALIFSRRLFLVQQEFSEAEKRQVIDGAVETFLARFGA
ncbi:MAG: TetR/AcrR family transcriptional regulator [Paracoccaceae bacterium]|nr:TetR/AcrR family transcriptional regulator [Paracoccaceae bacterium]